jgi:hypothetical protein
VTYTSHLPVTNKGSQDSLLGFDLFARIPRRAQGSTLLTFVHLLLRLLQRIQVNSEVKEMQRVRYREGVLSICPWMCFTLQEPPCILNTEVLGLHCFGLLWKFCLIGVIAQIINHWWSIQPSTSFLFPERSGGWAESSNLLIAWLVPLVTSSHPEVTRRPL